MSLFQRKAYCRECNMLFMMPSLRNRQEIPDFNFGATGPVCRLLENMPSSTIVECIEKLWEVEVRYMITRYLEL